MAWQVPRQVPRKVLLQVPWQVLISLIAIAGQISHGYPGLVEQHHGPQMPHINLQIVGGTAANIKQHGHQVSWLYRGDHRCGASILSPEWVVTAAHCVMEASVSDSQFLAGSSEVTHHRFHSRGHQLRNASEFHPHPQFDPLTFTYDVALIRVSPPFRMDEVVHPIAIVEAGGPPLVNDSVTVTGWGKLRDDDSPPSAHLQRVRVLVKDSETCRKQYASILPLTDTTMCAQANGKDACQGDSGGPLTYRGGDGKDRLVGVVSSGNGCALKDFPGLYTDLRHSHIREFISKTTGLSLS